MLLPAGTLAVVTCLLWLVPRLWQIVVGDEDARRNHTMDGARGLMTLWVLAHHFDVGPEMVQPLGSWRPPTGRLGELMGSGLFVAPFFALTSLLFTGRLLATNGRLNVAHFFRSHFLRLALGYVLSIALLFLTAFALTHFQLRVDPARLLRQAIRWSAVDFLARYDINTIDVSRAHGMLWTLRSEILFYLLLPVLAFLQRRTGTPAVLFVGLAIAGWFHWPFLFFLSGLSAAAALGWKGPRRVLVWQAGSVAGIALIILTSHKPSFVLQAVLIVPLLVSLVIEAPMLRWLAWRPIRLVGEASYSIYILHYPLIWIIFSVFIDPHWAERLPFVERMALGVACCCTVVVLAVLSFVFVERPFDRLRRASGSARGGIARAGGPAAPVTAINPTGLESAAWQNVEASGERQLPGNAMQGAIYTVDGNGKLSRMTRSTPEREDRL